MSTYLPIMKLGEAVNSEDVDGTSDTLAIPTIDSVQARVVRVAVTTATYILPVDDATDTVTNTTGHLMPANSSIVLDVTGYGFIAHIQDTAAGRISISAIS